MIKIFKYTENQFSVQQIVYYFAELSENEEGEEQGVDYDKLRPTYTHEALWKLVELGHLKHIISQNGDGLHGLSGHLPIFLRW